MFGVRLHETPEALLDCGGAWLRVTRQHRRRTGHRKGVRVGYFYTPPKLRGRGSASRIVAFLSQEMLDAGCAFCVLYTDLSNPTSNAMYQRVGYTLMTRCRALT